jgi:hypothetical protein
MNGMTTIEKIELELYFMINNTKAKRKKKEKDVCSCKVNLSSETFYFAYYLCSRDLIP